MTLVILVGGSCLHVVCGCYDQFPGFLCFWKWKGWDYWYFGRILRRNCKNLVGLGQPGKSLGQGFIDKYMAGGYGVMKALDGGSRNQRPVLQPNVQNVTFFFQANYMSRVWEETQSCKSLLRANAEIHSIHPDDSLYYECSGSSGHWATSKDYLPNVISKWITPGGGMCISCLWF